MAPSAATPATSSRTCEGTPTPIVSASTISSGPCADSLGQLEHAPRRHRALERAAERGADRHGDPQPVLARAVDQARRPGPTRPPASALVALAERVGGGKRVVHLVDASGQRPVVAALVEMSPAKMVSPLRSRPATTSSAPAICGTRFGLTKLTASTRGSPARARRSHSSARTDGSSVCDSFCRPSRGPTSQIVIRSAAFTATVHLYATAHREP